MGATSLDLSQIKSDALSAASTFRTLIGLGSSATLNAGSANGVATLDALGKLAASQVPDISLISYLGSVASQAAMLALTGQQGDWCVRSDLSTTWVITGSDPTLLANWTQLSYPSVPVQSVFGRTGNVVGVSTDYSAVGIDSTAIGAVTPSSGAFTSLTTSAHKITVGTITVGRGGQTSISTCLAVGFESLNSSSLSGIQNTAVGYRSLTATTSGNNNNAFGASSLIANTTGVRNCAYGAGSLLNNTSGSKNIAIGHLAGSNIDIGSSNVCVGDAASADVGSDSYQININNRYYHNRLRFGDTTPSYDVVLLRDAANTLAMQNGANAQRFNLYGTYDTGGTNYRRLYLNSTTTGAFTIGVEGAGTGVSGNTLELNPGATTTVATLSLTNALSIANGGTGATTQSAAANAILPSQTSNSGKYLTTNGTNVSWGTIDLSGYLTTSVAASTYLALSGGTLTGRLTTPSILLSGNYSSTAWTTSGVGLAHTTRTLTDTSSTGTVATAYTNVLGGNTIAASNATTFTDYASLFLGSPTAGTNVTITNPFSLITQGAVRVGGQLSIQNGTITANTPAIDVSQTWNNNSVGFTGFKFNATDTASNSFSLIADWQIGGVQRFAVSKLGYVSTNRIGAIGSGQNITFESNNTQIGDGGTASLYVSNTFNVAQLTSTVAFGWCSGGSSATSLDLVLRRDAANTLALRNDTNKQRFNLYGTYDTNGTNYRRLYLDSTTAGAFKIGVEGAGTGASGNTLELNSSTTKLGNYAGGPVTLDFNSGISLSCSLNASSLWALQFQDNQVRLAWVAGGAASQLRFSRHGANRSMISWGGSDTNDIKNSTQDAGIYSPSPGILEINSGTTGTLRDLSLRSLLPATGSVAVDTPILSATSTWDSNVSVTGASGTGTTATLTFSAMTTAFPVGSTIVVSSVNPSGYNGTFTVTASTTTSVSYANATTGAYVSGGNIQQQFTGIKLNVTDTSSDAGSLLLSLQKSGSNRLTIDKNGVAQIQFDTTVSNTGLAVKGTDGVTYGTVGFSGYSGWNSMVQLIVNGGTTGTVNIGAGQMHLTHSSGNTSEIRTYGNLVLSPGYLGGGGTVVEQRNGANAQNFRLYGTYTNASNYNRLAFTSTTGGAYVLQPENAGTSANAGSLTINLSGDATYKAQLEYNGGGLNFRLGAAPFVIQMFGDSFMPAGANTGKIGDEGYSRPWQYVYANRYSAGGLSLTGSQATALFDATATWNTTGTPTLIKANVTDTASNAASLLMDLQVGGTSKFKVAKDGWVTLTGAIRAEQGILYLSPAADTSFIQRFDATKFLILNNGSHRYRLDTDGTIHVGSGGGLQWKTGANVNDAGTHLYITADAANTLALRNGTSAQAFRIYNTTDAGLTNYERAKIAWSSNVLQIGTEKLGTGAARALELQTDGTTRLTIGTTGDVTLASGVLYLVGSSSSDMRLRKTSSGGATFELGNGLGYAGFIAGSIQSFVGSGSTTLRDSVGNLVVTNPESSTANVRLGSAYTTYPGVYCNNILNVMSETGTRFIVGVTSEKMRINTNGNVLINTTTDDGVSKLQVNGDITAAKATLSATLDLTIRTVTYGATMAIDAALGNKIAITLAGNGTISNPTNAVDGRVLVFRLRQDATGSRIPVWDTKYAFVGDLATVTLSTAANAIDRIAFEYDSTTDKWYCISFIKGS